jgi:pyruvate/2-oxoglutarate dehydrogenase complex dihydrolipoamide acyltransferase (E2) component
MDLIVPDLGEVEEVTLLRWLKGEGEEVEAGEAVAEVEADKAVFVIESPTAGILRSRRPEGSRVRPGEAIAQVLPG